MTKSPQFPMLVRTAPHAHHLCTAPLHTAPHAHHMCTAPLSTAHHAHHLCTAPLHTASMRNMCTAPLHSTSCAPPVHVALQTAPHADSTSCIFTTPLHRTICTLPYTRHPASVVSKISIIIRIITCINCNYNCALLLLLLGLYAKFAFAIEENNQLRINGNLINFEKLRMLWKVIDEIKHFQDTPYELVVNHSLLAYVRSPPSLSEDDIYIESVLREQRKPQLK